MESEGSLCSSPGPISAQFSGSMIKGCTKDTIGFEVVLKKGNREKMCGKD